MEEIKKHYNCGALHEHYYINNNGVPHGLFNVYHESGQLSDSMMAAHGYKVGEQKHWGATGVLLDHLFYNTSSVVITYAVKDIVLDITNLTNEDKLQIKLVFGINCL